MLDKVATDWLMEVYCRTVMGMMVSAISINMGAKTTREQRSGLSIGPKPERSPRQLHPESAHLVTTGAATTRIRCLHSFRTSRLVGRIEKG